MHASATSFVVTEELTLKI